MRARYRIHLGSGIIRAIERPDSHVPIPGRAFGAPTRWSSAKELAPTADVRFGDLNGDGRADACAKSPDGVSCAFSNGHGFLGPSLWLDRRVASFELGDINGDGRADLCAPFDAEVRCALAP